MDDPSCLMNLTAPKRSAYWIFMPRPAVDALLGENAARPVSATADRRADRRRRAGTRACANRADAGRAAKDCPGGLVLKTA